MKVLLPVCAAVVMSGCASKSEALYNYGSYSESYYAYKKNTCEESSLALKKAVEEAIENAGDSKSGRVAPGLYANLGYFYLKAGQNKKAIESFKKEKEIYPESAHFMNRVIKKAELAEKGKTKS
jgi:hypothetical protein